MNARWAAALAAISKGHQGVDNNVTTGYSMTVERQGDIFASELVCRKYCHERFWGGFLNSHLEAVQLFLQS